MSLCFPVNLLIQTFTGSKTKFGSYVSQFCVIFVTCCQFLLTNCGTFFSAILLLLLFSFIYLFFVCLFVFASFFFFFFFFWDRKSVCVYHIFQQHSSWKKCHHRVEKISKMNETIEGNYYDIPQLAYSMTSSGPNLWKGAQSLLILVIYIRKSNNNSCCDNALCNKYVSCVLLAPISKHATQVEWTGNNG